MKQVGNPLEFSFVKKFILYKLHIGGSTNLWCPSVKPYLKGFRNKLCIFNVELSSFYFKRALKFLLKLMLSEKKILFIGTPLGFENEFKILCAKHKHYVLDADFFGIFSNHRNLIKYYSLKSQKSLVFLEKPSLIFLFSLPSNSSILSELSKLDIPIMSFVNSDDELIGIDYILPGNTKTIKGSLFVFNLFYALFNSRFFNRYRT